MSNSVYFPCRNADTGGNGDESVTTVTWWRDSADQRYREDSDHPGTVVYVWVAPCGCRVDIRVRWDVVNARSGPLVKVAAGDTAEGESGPVVVLHDHAEARP